MKNLFKKQKGFTIIEVMTAVALFVVIMIIGIGALLNANTVHKKTQKIRTIMDNLSFIMEDMSRNIRTGTEYSCDNAFDCSDGAEFSFMNNNVTPTPEIWTYAIVNNNNPANPGNDVTKTTDSGLPNILNPAEVVLDSNSGFIVIGAKPQTTFPTDNQQPYVIIKLSGTINYKNQPATTFLLETSVSQRFIDI